MKTVTILWPERRAVGKETINVWYSDAMANGELEDDEIGIPDEDWLEQAKALHNAGSITLQRW